MDFDQAMRVFRLYCLRLEKEPAQADTMLLTENEKEAISVLKGVIREYSGLFWKEHGGARS